MILPILIIFYLLIAGLIFLRTKKSLYLFLGLLPFQPLLKTILASRVELSGLENLLLSGWKEFFIVLLFVFLVIKLIAGKKKINIDKSDYLIAFLFVISLISFLIFGESIDQLIFGLKYNFLFLLLYLSIKLIKFSREEITSLIKFFLITVAIVIFLGLAQLVLPIDTLAQIGYSSFADWQPDLGLQAFQQAGSYTRIAGPLSGPNQLGTYLVFSLLAFLGLTKFNLLKIRPETKKFYILLTIFVIFFTFSRSAWLALIVGLAIYYYLNRKDYNLKTRRTVVIGGSVIVAIAILLLIVNSDLLLRHTDQTRINRLNQSIGLLIDNPLGLGIGQVGPAAQWLKDETSQALVSENFYLQIGLELGIFGLIAYIWLLIDLLKKAYSNLYQRTKNLTKGLNLAIFISLIAVMVANLFLHSLTDATLAYSLAILLGLAFNYQLNQADGR